MTQPTTIRRGRGRRPRLLDLFCCQGGASKGYDDAGFDVTGGGFTLEQPAHATHTVPQAKMGRPVPPGHYGQFVGNFSGVQDARDILGVPWMNRDGIRECIPPAYAKWIGRAALASLAPVLGVAA
ncbi:hypothetical protein ACFVJK_31470 [Streptomyces sp. NPDC127172]|uniref:hypothetical protein n=1 Tax=Streptomyces sp. NPDC127172 TaxID=3345382 RepID=UPI003641110D